MEYIIAVLNGIAIKTVDDMEDKNISFLIEYRQYIYAICTAIFTLFLYNDVNLGLFAVLIFAPISYFMGTVDRVIWKALLPVAVLVLLLKINTIHYIGLFDIIEKFIVIILASLYMVIQAVVFPEERSSNKTVFRFSQFLMFLFLTFMIGPFLSNQKTIQALCLFNCGYFFTSVVFDTMIMDRDDVVVDNKTTEDIDKSLNKCGDSTVENVT